VTLGVQHAERPPHIGYSHSLAGPSRVAAVSRRQQQRRQLVHPTPPSTAFFFHLDPMIAPFMFCNRFSACFTRDPLRMYCLSLIVSDYPAKLSHPALQQQQVLASHMPPHAMLAAPIHRPRNLAPPRSCTCCRWWPSTLPPLYPTCVPTHATFSKSSSYVFLAVSSP
jgi:hypothetical protein